MTATGASRKAGGNGRGRFVLFLLPFAISLLIALRLWFSAPAEEWRLQREPLTALQRRVAAGQADFRAAQVLGDRLMEAGRFADAEPVYRRLIGADSENWGAYARLGTLLTRTGRQSEAFQVLQIPVNRRPEFGEGRRAMADLYLSRQAYLPAIRELQAVTQLEPRQAEPWFHLYQCYDALSQPSHTRQTLEEAVRRAPRDDGYQVELARLLRKQGQTAAAEAHLRQALALNPDSAPAHYTLGETLAAHPGAGDMEGATAEFRTVLRHAPDYPPAYYQLGLLAGRRGDWPAAAAEFRAALRVAPEFKEAVFQLARAEDRLGQAAAARQHRSLFVRLTEQEQQILDLRTRLGFGGGDSATYLRLARAYRAAGDLDRAYETLVAALQRAPTHPVLRAEMRAVAAQSGRPAEGQSNGVRH